MSSNREETESRDLRRDDLEIKGPMGWSLRINGKQVILFIVVIAVTAGLGYMVHEHDVNTTFQIQQLEQRRMSQIGRVEASQTRLQESIDSVVYVLSLRQEEREKLNITMPPSLRKRINENGR